MRYLIYDDECDFCCSIVIRLKKVITNYDIKYIPLKSNKGEELVNKYKVINTDSVIYIDIRNVVYLKAAAILSIIKLMRSPYNLLSVLNIFPISFLNIIYDFIARNRMVIKI
tara:strand:- start:385 stop:720 length:336 start_codon:yes stop_codon:yes gene_type:complete